VLIYAQAVSARAWRVKRLEGATHHLRKKLYTSIKELQDDLDEWIRSYNEERPHQGRWCFGKAQTQTFLDTIPIAKEKMIAA
jgi:Integrase core domain